MKIVLPAHPRALLFADLARSSLDDPGWSRRGRALLALGHGFAGRLDDDTEALALVERFLTIGALGHRHIAAEILLTANDPRGIPHLTYNAVGRHPTLGEDQTGISGWNDVRLLRHAHLLTAECVDLLIDDVVSPPHWFHAEVLAAAPGFLAVPRLHRVLETTSGSPALQAAFALAMHGEPEGRDALLAALAGGDIRALEMALVAFSHLPNPEAIAAIRRVAEGTHPILERIPVQFVYAHRAKEWWDFRRRDYRSRAEQRLAILEGGSSVTDLFRRYYRKPQREAWRTRDWGRRVGLSAPIEF